MADTALVEKFDAFFVHCSRSLKYGEATGRDGAIVDHITNLTRDAEEVAWLLRIVGILSRDVRRMKGIERVIHSHTEFGECHFSGFVKSFWASMIPTVKLLDLKEDEGSTIFMGEGCKLYI